MTVQPSARGLPRGPLLAFYGDDFTGSSAAMEVLAFTGVPTVLFLETPTREQLARFSRVRAIGIAGTARAQSNVWMNTHLGDVFRLLADLGAPVLHYKTCSTFDSAPHIGSIGRAIDLFADLLVPHWIPMVVADPAMGRFQCFGHLFAKAGPIGYRLDRHPTMARHPTTPMEEADLGLHLARQTKRKIGLVDFTALKAGRGSVALEESREDGAEIVSIDVIDDETLVEAGRLIWEYGGERIVAVGSQGVEASLVAYWQATGLLPTASPTPAPKPVDRIAGVSGSVSPVTAAQIDHARAHGFRGIAIDASLIVDDRGWEREVARVTAEGMAALDDGKNPLIFSACGPDDPAVIRMREAVEAVDMTMEAVNERLGAGLGIALRRILEMGKLSRLVISGGDTSGRAAAQLGIFALTAIAPIDPGSPLCRAWSEDAAFDGLEIALKGGQVGQADFFSAVQRGGR